jgi:hypothetical protein
MMRLADAPSTSALAAFRPLPFPLTRGFFILFYFNYFGQIWRLDLSFLIRSYAPLAARR